MKGVLNARLFYIRDDICIVILIPEFALHAFFFMNGFIQYAGTQQ